MPFLLLLRSNAGAFVAPASTSPPTITGTPRTGAILVAQPGGWSGDPAPTFAFQWQRDVAGNGTYSNIAGANSATYAVQTGDVGDHLRVVVTAINQVGVTPATSAPTALVTAPTFAGRKAAYPVEIGWGQTSSGLFTFGISTFGSTSDRLAAAGWSRGFAGPFDQVTADVIEFAIQRGRDSDLTTMRAGSLNLTLRDHFGLYNPENPASPLAGFLDTDKPVRVSGTTLGGATFPLFYGFVTDVQSDPSARGQCVITASDFLDKLDRQNPIFTSPAGSSDGTVLGAILDWFRWTDPAMRQIDTGDTIPTVYTRADGSRSGLALVEELLAAERGIVFASAGGAVTYRSRLNRYLLASSGTIDKTMTAFPIGRSNANITNQWTITRTDMDGNAIGVPQIWPDPNAGLTSSQQLHGIIPGTLETPFLISDGQALNLAQYMTMRTQSGLALVYDVPINIADTATLGQVLARDLGDRVTLTLQPRTMPAFTADFAIESINHQVTSKGSPRHACNWQVSAIQNIAPAFRFGVSLMGSGDLLYY